MAGTVTSETPIISPIRDTELQVIHDTDIENVYRCPAWRVPSGRPTLAAKTNRGGFNEHVAKVPHRIGPRGRQAVRCDSL